MLLKQHIHLKEDLTYKEEPVKILEGKHQVLRSKTLPLVKVLWRNHTKEEATWDRKDLMQAQYPCLFFIKYVNFEDEIFISMEDCNIC